ncbi:hypothetical protein [Nocardia puris]|uniref:hypothetical protein n=1 Tax=Nocardia puris TaxID=208602 RepID=UPI002B4B51AB|nr:hypothetical protein [Nocardia puris]
MPPQYGSWSAVYGLFRRWQRGGVWWLIVKMLQVFADATGSRSPRSVVGGRGYGRSEYWPTKRIPLARTGRGCAGMGSGRRSRFQRIRPPIAVIVVRAAVGLRRSTRLSIVTRNCQDLWIGVFQATSVPAC